MINGVKRKEGDKWILWFHTFYEWMNE